MGRNFCVLKTCDRVHCLGLEQGTSRGGGNPLGGLRDSWAHPAPIHRLPFVVCFKQMVAYFFPVYTWGPQPSVQADPALGTHRLLSGGRGWHDPPPPAWGGWLLAGWSAELLWGRSLREGQARVPPPRLSVTVSLPLPAQVGGLPSLPVSTAPGSWGVWRSPEGAKGLPAGARLAQSWGEAEWLRGGVAVRRGEGRGSMWGGHSQVMLTESPPRSAGHPPPPTPHGFRAVSPPARVGFCTPAPKGPGVRRPGAPVAALGPAACEQPGAGSDSSAAALPPRPQGTWSHRPARLGALLRPRSHRCAARRRGSRLTPLAAASASWPHATPPVAPSPPRAGPASQDSRSWGGRGLRVPGRGEQRRLVLIPEPP